MSDEWKDIVGYEGYYKISNTGEIKSLERFTKSNKTRSRKVPAKIINFRIDKDGYKTRTLCKDAKKYKISEHRLVALTFLPNPNNLLQVNHKNGIKTDNRVENLEWCTDSENKRHALDNDLKIPAKGDSIGTSKITNEQAIKIKQLFKKGYTTRKISDIFQISYQLVWKIKKDQTWSHIKI